MSARPTAVDVVVREAGAPVWFVVFAGDPEGREVGTLCAELLTRHADRALREECRADVAAVARALGRAPEALPLWYIHGVGVRPEYRGTGLGSELYLSAVRHAATRYDAALLGGACVVNGGRTTDDGRRMWASRRFNAEVVRSGLVAYWVGPREDVR